MHIRLIWRIISLGRDLSFRVRDMALELLKAEIDMLLETSREYAARPV